MAPKGIKEIEYAINDDAPASRLSGSSPQILTVLLSGEEKKRCIGLPLREGLVVTLVSGVGLLTDLFDFSVINIAKLLLEREYGTMSASTEGMLTAAALLGAVFGQLLFGWLADRLGRRNTFLASAALTMLGALGSALAFPVDGSGEQSIYTVLTAWRFVMGIGIGGEYPLSAANTAEGVDHRTSGQSLAAVYSMMGVGLVLAPLLFVVLLGAGVSNEAAWRLGFAAGAVLSCGGLVLRYRELGETEAFQEEKRLRDEGSASAGSVPAIDWKKWMLPLVGTSVSWFLYDIVHYGLGLYSSEILGHNSDPFDSAVAVLGVNAIAMPSFFLGIYLVKDNVLGRRDSQTLGFLGMMVVFLIIVATKGVVWGETKDDKGKEELNWPHSFSYWVFLLLYTVQLMFDAAGPGMSTYVIPAEIYPTRIRGTFHGFSAACGKLGAVLGSFAIPAMRDAINVESVMILCLFVTGPAALVTVMLTPGYANADLGLLKVVSKEAGDEETIALLYKGSIIRARVCEEYSAPKPPVSSWFDLATKAFLLLSPLSRPSLATEEYLERVITEKTHLPEADAMLR